MSEISKLNFERELNKDAPKKIEAIAQSLIDNNIIIDITYYDGEILFTFKNIHLDNWADIFKLKKSGANISPLSLKNLPKSEYVINKNCNINFVGLKDSDASKVYECSLRFVLLLRFILS